MENKFYLNDLLNGAFFDTAALVYFEEDERGFYTTDEKHAEWFKRYANGYKIADELGIEFEDYEDYADLSDLEGHEIDKLKQEKVRQEVEEYLSNYGKSHSTETDNKFNMFKSDVASLAKDVENGDAYVYTKYEWLEFLQEQLDEAEDKEYFENKIKEFEGYNFDVLVDTLGSENQYMV